MAGTINHRLESDVPDSGDENQVSSDAWNDTLVVAGGNDGEVMARESAEADGWKMRKLGASPAWCDVSQTANSGTATSTLATFTIPAAHFDVNKRAVRMRSFLTTSADTAAKTITVTFGATSVAVNPVTTAPNAETFEIEFIVMRSTGASAQRYTLTVRRSGVAGTGAIEKLATGTLAIDTSAAVAIAVKAASTASTKVTHNLSTLEYLG